jgi:predicted TIM-barrel fold metal-dependent hydrolase
MINCNVIDADGHLSDTDEGILPFLDERFRQRRRPFYPRDNFDRQMGRQLGHRAKDAASWAKAMDLEGIDVAVLYPTDALAIGVVRERDFAVALCRAYNDFVYEQFVKPNSRLKAVALIPLQDVTAAVQELNRAVTKLGMVGAMLPANGSRQLLGRHEYWPVYEEAQRLDTALAVHAGRFAHEFGTDLCDRFVEVHTLTHPFALMAQLTSMMFSGVPEKFPRLRLAFLEAGCGWIPYWMERLDEEYEKRASEAPLLKGKPSEYVKNGRIYYSCECEEETLPYVLDRVGNDVILYASDFPHWDSNYPHTVKSIADRTTLSDDQKRKVLSENARRFYRLD